MLGFYALFQESPKSPITQDETAIMLQYADQHYRKDVGAEVASQIRFMGKKFKHFCDGLSTNITELVSNVKRHD